MKAIEIGRLPCGSRSHQGLAKKNSADSSQTDEKDVSRIRGSWGHGRLRSPVQVFSLAADSSPRLSDGELAFLRGEEGGPQTVRSNVR